MTTIVIRGKGHSAPDASNPLDQIIGSIPWPDGGISASRLSPHHPWEFYTVADRLREKRKRMNREIFTCGKNGLASGMPAIAADACRPRHRYGHR